MNKISEFEGTYKLKSPDGRFIAKYNGLEYGMGSPTLGNFVITTDLGKNAFSFPGYAPASFSDDSKYFIFGKPYGFGSNKLSLPTAIDLSSGLPQN